MYIHVFEEGGGLRYSEKKYSPQSYSPEGSIMLQILGSRFQVPLSTILDPLLVAKSLPVRHFRKEKQCPLCCFSPQRTQDSSLLVRVSADHNPGSAIWLVSR